MEADKKILSDVVVHSKYARYIPELERRETWGEIVDRNKEMHKKKYPHIADTIEEAYKGVYDKKYAPSMRSLQFGGVAIERNPARIYNCAYMPIDHTDSFSELMFLLLGGTGVGYSVQYRHTEALPIVRGTNSDTRRYVIGDSIEGWADSVKVLVESHFYGKEKIRFDFGDIREKGALLITSGGKAPGSAPLRKCLVEIDNILYPARGRRLTPLEAHDICCHIADAVLAGGIRRAALISLFSPEDNDMLNCKSGSWWEQNPQRGRANNSVSLLRGSVTKEQFDEIWARVKASGAGEPGVYWTNNLDWGTNPCCEIALRPYQFCNLVEVNGSSINGLRDFAERVHDATTIATLQAGYTDFHYLRPIWKETTEEDALIGVGITGIASNKIKEEWLDAAAALVQTRNQVIAKKIGINVAKRTTTIKPSGTSSLVFGSSSGIHAWHNSYYVRRMRINKNESIYGYLLDTVPHLIEDEFFDPENTAVLSVPQCAPKGSVVRTESAMELLARVGAYNTKWVREGHREGDNANNVSVTISLKEEDWKPVGEWMWENRELYNGISVLPYDGGTYKQAPFEDITKAQYDKLMKFTSDIDLSKVKEISDETDLAGELACAGGACEIF